MCSLFTSIFLYACESWTLTVDLQRIRTMEISCYRKILRISYKDHVTNEKVCAKIQQAIGPHEDPLTIVKRRKLKWYGACLTFIRPGHKHLARHSERGKTKAGRKRSGKLTSGNGQALSSQSPRGQWRAGKKWRKLVNAGSLMQATMADHYR